MKKFMFRRIGATAVACVMALSLMATPAFATGGTDDQQTLTINNAIEGATYRIVPLMKLDVTSGDGGAIAGYKYTLAENALGTAVRGVIEGSEFEAKTENGAVTQTGFQIVDNSVVFRAVTDEGQTEEAAYKAWAESAEGKMFMSRFADAVKAAVEGLDTSNMADVVTVKATGETVEVDLDYGYWMVISGAGQRAIISTNPANDGTGAVINEKNEAPGLTKKVYETATGEYTDKSDGSIGDLVLFQSVINAGTGLNHLTFKDTLSDGLTFVALTNVDFYPRDDKGNVTYAPDENGVFPTEKTGNRSFYLNSINGDTTNGTGGSLLPAKSDGRFDWNDGGWSGITLKDKLDMISIDAALEGQTLTINFDEVWLLSKRSDSTDPDNQPTNREDYKNDPMYPNDERLATIGGTDNTGAMYNAYLGDMTTTADDGGKIVIQYVARINESAKIGGIGNTNEAHLEYGNDPDSEKIPTTPVETHTYVYELDVLKHMSGDKTTVLEGAKFELRRAWMDLTKNSDGSITVTDVENVEFDDKLHFAKEGDVYRVKASDEDVTDNDTELVSDANGSIKIKGLDADLYELTETEAPAGYIKADKPFYAILGGVAAGTADVNSDTKVVTMSAYVQKDNKDNKNTFVPVTGDQLNQVAVENASGLRMPETGGIGTTIFYIVGGLLVCGAGVLLVVKKRVGDGEK